MPSPFNTGNAPIPTDRVDLGQLVAVVDAVRSGRSTMDGFGLTSAVATGDARRHRDRRTTARLASVPPAASPAAVAAEAPRPPRRLRNRRRVPLPVRPGVLPVATTR